MDPGCAPKWVPVHPPDQISEPRSITRFQTPKHFEPTRCQRRTVSGLNHLHLIKKARPKPRHPYEKSAIAATQSKTRRCPPHDDGLLMTEKQILGHKPAPRLEQ